jgi:hypothetical protein
MRTARRAGLWCALALVLGLGAGFLVREPRRALANEQVVSEVKADDAVATARALVGQLEARARSAEENLKQARQLLAGLEGGATRVVARRNSHVEISLGSDDGLVDGRPLRILRGAAARNEVNGGNDLEGVWRLVGLNGHETGVYRDAPYAEYKIMGAGHYLWMSYAPDTGEIRRIGGGNYTSKDGNYTAHVECSNAEDLRGIIGQEYKFTYRLDGKKWHLFGPMPNGAVVDELWERVN